MSARATCKDGRMTRHLNRRIAALFFANVSGYSRLMAASE
jgi:hypothetical protein